MKTEPSYNFNKGENENTSHQLRERFSQESETERLKTKEMRKVCSEVILGEGRESQVCGERERESRFRMLKNLTSVSLHYVVQMYH